MADFKDNDEIEAWLNTQPRDVISVFAARAALRAVPHFTHLIDFKELETSPETIILPSFWAMATALSAGTWPDKDVMLFNVAGAAANATDATDAAVAGAAADAATDAATAAAYAADAVYLADAAAAAAAADAAAAAAVYLAADADAAAVYKEYTLDRDIIGSNGKAQDLLAQPLWQGGLVSADILLPNDLGKKWLELKKYLLDLKGQEWDVWTDWYEDRLIGKPLIQAIEIGDPESGQFGRVTFPEEDYQDPAIVNPKIKAVIQEYLSQQEFEAIFEDDPDIDKIVEATPLAEDITFGNDGKFDVEFLPVIELFDKNLDRIADALKKALGANAFNASSEEIQFLQEILDNHSDDPQRIHDDCDFVHKAIQSLVEKDIVSDSFPVRRLQNTIRQTANDIRAYEPKVQEVVETRAKLHIDVNKPLDGKLLGKNQVALEPILSDRLKTELKKHLNEILGAFGLADRAGSLYKLASRYSRIYQQIVLKRGDSTISDTVKLSFHHAQPHLAEILEILKPLLGM